MLPNGLKRYQQDLDPLAAGYLDAMIDAEIAAARRKVTFDCGDTPPETAADTPIDDPRTLRQIGADAIVEMAKHALSCDSTTPALASATVMVRMSLDSLLTGLGEAEVIGQEQWTPLLDSAADGRRAPNAATARSFADAETRMTGRGSTALAHSVGIMRILNIVSSPRVDGASVTVANAFLEAVEQQHPDVEIDTLDVWKENLPEFDQTTIGAKYKGVSGEEMDETEQRLWNRITELVKRFRSADRIVLGVPMWNWAYPYKLKQLIDLVSQRGMLFTFDGTNFGPALDIDRALVIFVRGQYYSEDGPTPASQWDHQTGFITFFLKTIGVHDVQSLVVEHTWDDQKDAAIASSIDAAKSAAREFC